MTNRPATAILIAGVHRSGTSALAGALGKLGIPLGERLLEPAPDNPKGYWEHQDFVSVHERLLAALGSRWDDVRALPSNWLTSDPARHAANAIEALITRDFSDKNLWAVKDPRLCRFLPLWLEVLRRKDIQQLVVLMVRKPSEVSASIAARDHWRAPIGEMLWLRYIGDAEAASRNVSRSVILYDDLLAEPASTVSKALRTFGVTLGPPSADERRLLAKFIDKADRHHVHNNVGEVTSEFAVMAEAVYASLTSVAHGKDAWASVKDGTTAFERHWERVGDAIDALAEMNSKIASDAESEWVENKILSSKLTAQIRWSDEAQANREALQADNAELQSKLNAQVRWSNEAKTKHEALQAENAELSSKLNAQIRWSEEAQAKREALQAAYDTLLHDKQGRDQLAAELQRVKTEAEQAQNTLTANLQEMMLDRDHLTAELQRVKTEAEQTQNTLAANLQEMMLGRDHLAGELQDATNRASSLAAKLATIESSLSWKLMRPLRATARILGSVRDKS